MQVARNRAGGEALMALNVDSSISAQVVAAVAKETGAELVRALTLIS
ncbi:unannotated protein [freshwater metagenome]